MSNLDVEIEHALRRSVASLRILLVLHELREARTGQLARGAGIASSRVKWIYAGHMPYYRPDQSHRALGLVTRHGRPRRWVYRITPEGDRAAKRVLRERWRQGLGAPARADAPRSM